MQRASESIGALAAALAKAQIQLTNPEKSLVATIREEGRHGESRRFATRRFPAGSRSSAKSRPARDCDRADHLD